MTQTTEERRERDARQHRERRANDPAYRESERQRHADWRARNEQHVRDYSAARYAAMSWMERMMFQSAALSRTRVARVARMQAELGGEREPMHDYTPRYLQWARDHRERDEAENGPRSAKIQREMRAIISHRERVRLARTYAAVTR